MRTNNQTLEKPIRNWIKYFKPYTSGPLDSRLSVISLCDVGDADSDRNLIVITPTLTKGQILSPLEHSCFHVFVYICSAV